MLTGKANGFFLSLALQTLALAAAALFRFIDSDEGYYLLASKLVLQGRGLYQDFFYPQMPVLPLAYAAWFGLFGVSWEAGRLFSAIMALLTGLLVFHYILNLSKRPALALTASITYCTATFTFGWLTVCKTYSLSALLLMSALYVSRYPPKILGQRGCAAAGALIGLAAAVRLPCLAAALAFFIFLAASRRFKEHAPTFLLGLGLGLLPALFFLARAPAEFIFDNLQFHSIRTAGGLIGNFRQKFDLILQTIGLGPAVDVSAFQTLLFSLGGAGLMLRHAVKKTKPPLVLWLTVVLTFVFFLPTPAYLQYLAALTPFYVISLFELYISLEGSAARRGPIYVKRIHAAGAIGLLLYLAAAAADFKNYFLTGEVLSLGFPVSRKEWSIFQVKQVSSAVEKLSTPNQCVIAWWPGYLLTTNRRILPGLENHFTWTAAQLMTPEQRARRKLVTNSEIWTQIEQGICPLVVTGNWSQAAEQPPGGPDSRLRKFGYQIAVKAGEAGIYRRPDPHRGPG